MNQLSSTERTTEIISDVADMYMHHIIQNQQLTIQYKNIINSTKEHLLFTGLPKTHEILPRFFHLFYMRALYSICGRWQTDRCTLDLHCWYWCDRCALWQNLKQYKFKYPLYSFIFIQLYLTMQHLTFKASTFP